ncbi:hypothetical protein K493DRAFT_370239 [Basidiobolus meristosporus CBS 931.73]|uniref:Uncharacterized protein n=1 Tax=Basidiobolus meristosporus CBS 931.73 TaxID=1314790 RepID=A0A1Y1YGJ7_9FUNG|nr:hypothetical protein K493DRAFT_370239 [Basidiobolus meristosporus CBS 931.73]|eukprot:ORX97078.1 hypothetical protein K493DRAFT_370239 [Basidiobolus meristosporus CBS 931.73]
MRFSLPYASTLLLLVQGIHCMDQRTEVRVKVDVDNKIYNDERNVEPFSLFLRDTDKLLGRFREEIRAEHERRVRSRHQALHKISILEEEIKRRWNHARKHLPYHRHSRWEKQVNNLLHMLRKVRKMIKNL